MECEGMWRDHTDAVTGRGVVPPVESNRKNEGETLPLFGGEPSGA